MADHPLVGKRCKFNRPIYSFVIPDFIKPGCTVRVIDVYDRPAEEPGFSVMVDGWIGKAFEHELEVIDD